MEDLMDLEQFNSQRTTVATRCGEVSYVDAGSGPPAVFVHGVLMSSYLWRDVIAGLAGERRCLALDLPGHGRTPVGPGQDVGLPALADLLEAFCAALELNAVDLVANDTGGAVCQIFAAQHPERISTLALTNCDVHDQIPPEAFTPAVEAARNGLMARALVEMYAQPERAREALAQGFERPERLSDETIHEYFGPFAQLEGARAAERAVTSLDAADLIAAEPRLAELDVPTLIAWGTEDVFFEVKWAHWLERAIKGALPVIEIPGAKLFWPAERPDELIPLLREHWNAHAPARAGA
jgi:pimeloyl-ACP methyl ester carboxylesterase